MRRIGVPDDCRRTIRIGSAAVAAFLQGLQQLGWADGRNVRIDIRWAAERCRAYRRYAAELVALAPDVILITCGTVPAVALQQATRTVPIVFAIVPIRSAPASSKAWRGRAATPPDSSSSNTV